MQDVEHYLRVSMDKVQPLLESQTLQLFNDSEIQGRICFVCVWGHFSERGHTSQQDEQHYLKMLWKILTSTFIFKHLGN